MYTRSSFRFVLLSVSMVAAAVSPPASAEMVPLVVSPGSLDVMATIPESCPTFSWSAGVATKGYELIVYRLLEGETGEDAAELFRVRLPAGSQSWTPSLERCLDQGGRYAWSVRTAGPDASGDWAPAALFSVAPGPTIREIEALLARMRRETTGTAGRPLSEDEAALAGGGANVTNTGGNFFNEDVQIAGDLCVGAFCTDGENVPVGAVRVNNDNAWILFNDGSTVAGFPSNDWEIRINDSFNGGANYFAIRDTTAGTVPFRIDAGAGTDSVKIADGFVDFGGDLFVPDGELTTHGVNLASSREWKEAFAAVDTDEVLAKLLSIPVDTWSFKDDRAVRHIGPTSEDFHAAFDLPGADRQHLAVTDVNGVALAAIQALARRVAEQEAALQKLCQGREP